ncbi:hypothetical protein H4S04_005482 [Coemansia sp. S16]|nr:hypothetical protein H4S04_005482 [Coemansia sp. S16]KAJ2068767.1 hypothetical protein GGI08_000697 [Coemansia sp. S2]KAJ2352139.1 hypothetical protein GGH92_001437 [Coemansia sp. RSA 2673]
MVSLSTYATAAALVAVCSVQVSGKKPPKSSKTSKCNLETATATQCVKSSKYKYCDEDKSIWVTATMEPDMECDAKSMLVDTSSASAIGKGPAVMVLGVAVAIWSFM